VKEREKRKLGGVVSNTTLKGKKEKFMAMKVPR
jgi:hypothetical protein